MGGMLDRLGVLGNILNAITGRINSDGSLILASLLVGYVTSLISCSQPMSHVLTGNSDEAAVQGKKGCPGDLIQNLRGRRDPVRSYDPMAWLLCIHGRNPGSGMVCVLSVSVPAVFNSAVQCFLRIQRNLH